MKSIPQPLQKLALLFGLVSIALLSSIQVASAQSKTFYWEDWIVEMTLLENGDMMVTETQTLNFAGEPFTFGFRSIPTGVAGQNDGITDVSVREGDRVYTNSASNEPYTFQVSGQGDETRIDWYFEPALGTHSYTFSYRVLGPVRVGTLEEGDGDQLFWKVLPPDHPGRVENTTAIVRLPEGIEPQRYYESDEYLVEGYINDEPEAGIQTTVTNGNIITYEYPSTVYNNDSLAVRVQWPHGLMDIETPNWQNDMQSADVLTLALGALAMLLCLGGPLGVLALWYTRGRDPNHGIIVPDFISEPPDDLPPALVGTLVDEKADMRDIVSMLVDLARRGYIQMGEVKRDKHRFRRTDKAPDGLRPYERQFLKDLFGGKEERTLEDLRYKFHSKLPRIRNLLYDDLVAEGFVSRSPESVRKGYRAFGMLLIMVAGISFVAILALSEESPIVTMICPAIAIGITGLFLTLTASHMPRKTVKGVQEAAKWDAFKKYLKDIEKHQDLAASAEIFDRYLPYATAFGIDRSWIKKFSKVPTTPIPRWYIPYGYGWAMSRPHASGGGTTSAPAGGGMQAPTLEGMSEGMTGGLESMSDGLTRVLSSSQNVLQSTPPSSSGSSGGFSGGFSGGGGFSSGGGGSAGFG